MLMFLDRRGNEPVIRVDRADIHLEKGNRFEVAFFCKEIYYLFETYVTAFSENTYRIQKPAFISSSIRRMIKRYKIGENDEAYIYLNSQQKKYRVLDINTSGVSFFSDEKFLEEGQVIRNIIIKMANGSELCVDGSVRYCRECDEGYAYGLLFSNMDWNSHNELFTYIFDRGYPALKSLSEFSINEIYELFDKSGYLHLKPKNEMEKYFMNMVNNYEKIKDKNRISSNLVYYYNNKLLTSASVLRIYDRTFLGHQLASLPEAKMNLKSKTDVYFGLADFLMNNPYFEYYLTYFDISLEWHDEMYKRIGKYINDQNKFIFDNIHFFEYTISNLSNDDLNDDYTCNVIDDPEEFMNFCRKSISLLEIDCYSYNSRHINLFEIKQIYEALDLYATRKLWYIRKGENIVAYAVAEAYTDGLNLFNLLDSCRIYFTTQSSDIIPVMNTLLNEVTVFYKKYKKSRFNVLFKIEEDFAQKISIPGFEHKHSAGRVMMNREGMNEYRKILEINFSQVG